MTVVGIVAVCMNSTFQAPSQGHNNFIATLMSAESSDPDESDFQIRVSPRFEIEIVH